MRKRRGTASSGTNLRLVGLCFGLTGACVGQMTAGDTTSERPETSGPGAAPAGTAPGPSTGRPSTSGPCQMGAGFSPLRRLTRAEYNATVADLLGETSRPADGFVPDDKIGPFDGNGSSPVSSVALDQYWEAAEALSVRALDRLPSLLPCDPTSGEDACARVFAERLGLRAYRRPLDKDEVDALVKAYDAGKTGGGFKGGVRRMLNLMLAAPSFLYHVELGQGTTPRVGLAPLTGHEIAARLSYFVWGSMPDQALFDAAASGELTSAAGVEKHARRLMSAERAALAFRRFNDGWLGLEEVSVRRNLPPALVSAAEQDVLTTLEDLLWKNGRPLSEMFTTDVAYVNAALAPSYGLATTGLTATPRRVTLPQDARRGVLSRVAALISHTNPTARGKFVRTTVLCQDVPPPPANVDTTLPEPKAGEPPRKRWERHIADPSCGGCHKLLDPIGFGLDNFDDMGKYRDMDGGFPVETRGELSGVAGGPLAFEGPRDLQERLARAPETRACLVQQWFTLAYGRLADAAGLDRCTLEAAVQSLSGKEDVRDLMVALVKSDAFRQRRVEP